MVVWLAMESGVGKLSYEALGSFAVYQAECQYAFSASTGKLVCYLGISEFSCFENDRSCASTIPAFNVSNIKFSIAPMQ